MWNDRKTLEEIVKKCICKADVLRELNLLPKGSNYKTFDRYIKLYNIDTSHFDNRKARKSNKRTCYKIPIEDYLNNERFTDSAHLRKRLIKDKILPRKCDNCNLCIWLNEPIPLELHHIDGNHFNNNLTNLQLLCPNCHSLTDNYCGKKNKHKEESYCDDCGIQCKDKNSARCTPCNNKFKALNNPNRPSKEILIQDFISLKSYVQVGKKYHVSDNAIRKWCEYYDLPKKSYQMKAFISASNSCP